MKVLIPTIKHSGSHLCLDAFLGAGFTQGTVKSGWTEGDSVIMDHVLYTKLRQMTNLAEQADVVIVPIRHPNLIAVSWGLQGEEIRPDLFQMLKDIKPFMLRDNSIVLPLGGDTDSQVDAIAAATQVRIDPNTPVKSVAGTWKLSPDTGKLHEVLSADDIERLTSMDLTHILASYESVSIDEEGVENGEEAADDGEADPEVEAPEATEPAQTQQKKGPGRPKTKKPGPAKA